MEVSDETLKLFLFCTFSPRLPHSEDGTKESVFMHGNISKRVVGGEIRSPLPSYSVFWCVLSLPYPFSSSSCLFNGPPLSALEEEDEEEDAAAKKGRYFPCDLGKRRRGRRRCRGEGGSEIR